MMSLSIKESYPIMKKINYIIQGVLLVKMGWQ